MEEKEGKASRLSLGGNGSLKASACGSLNYSGARGFKRWGPGREWKGEVAVHLRTLLVVCGEGELSSGLEVESIMSLFT